MAIDLMKIVHCALFTPLRPTRDGEQAWGLVPLLWGEPGIGKSALVREYGHTWQLLTRVLSPGTDGEGAFGVTPVPSTDMSTMTYPPPYWADQIKEGGIVFLDEVNQAPPALQPAIMGIALDRRIGDCVLSPVTRRIAAANPTDIAAGGWDLQPPTANRFVHLDWEPPTSDAWGEWLLESNIAESTVRDPEAEQERVLTAWTVPWARASSIVVNFLRARPELLQNMPKAGSKELTRAWPSARTWEMASRSLAAAEVHGLTDAERDILIGGCVGDAACNELMTYIAELDLPDPVKVLDGKVKWKHDPKRLDTTAAVLSACASLVTPPDAEKRQPRAAKLWEILQDKGIQEDAIDVGFLAAKRMVVAGLHVMKEAGPVLKKMLPILKEAGIRFDANEVKKAKSGYGTK